LHGTVVNLCANNIPVHFYVGFNVYQYILVNITKFLLRMAI